MVEKGPRHLLTLLGSEPRRPPADLGQTSGSDKTKPHQAPTTPRISGDKHVPGPGAGKGMTWGGGMGDDGRWATTDSTNTGLVCRPRHSPASGGGGL